MARVFTLSSGSDGNCTFVGDGNYAVLIDVGISFSKVKKALENYNIELSHIKALLITHEHSDHIKGICTFCKKTDIPIIASPKTVEYIIMQYPELEDRISAENIGKEFFADKMSVTPFSVSHDAKEAVGYRIKTADNRTVAYSTDTGVVTDDMFSYIKDADLNIIEANYDEGMLACNISYPFLLKQRISGEFGHLSNLQCAQTVLRLIENGNKRFVLAHLSHQNNTPEVALSAVKAKLIENGFVENVDFEINVAPRLETSRMLIF